MCHDKDFVCAPYALTTGQPVVEGGRFGYAVSRHTHLLRGGVEGHAAAVHHGIVR
jgi:hypothetical protein